MTSRSDRTEKPTPKRLRDAKRKGEVPKSQEVPVAMSLLLLAITIRVIAPYSTGVVLERTAEMLRGVGSADLSGPVGSSVVAVLAATLLPVTGLAVVAAVASGLAQVGFTWSPMAAQPKLSHLSIKKGLSRYKPSKAAWELARSILKIGMAFAVSLGALRTIVDTIAGLRGFEAGLGVIFGAVWQILVRVALLMTVIAVADYAMQRYRNRKELKMSKDEVRREMRETDGNPEMKAARRRRASEMSRNRMITAAASADVIVTNPTHIAVALKYEKNEPAPRVVSKGANELAGRIRKAGRRNGVPVFEDKPLARALFRKVKVGAFVPTALFEAVALILALAYRRKVRR